MKNLQVSDADGALSTGGSGTNYAFDASPHIGGKVSVTAAPPASDDDAPAGYEHADFTLLTRSDENPSGEPNVGLALTEEGTPSAGSLAIGAFSAPIVVWITDLGVCTHPGIIRAYDGFTAIEGPALVSGIAQSDSSAQGSATDVETASGVAASDADATGDVTVFSDVQDVSGTAQSGSSATGAVADVAAVTGAAQSTSAALGDATVAPSGPDYTFEGASGPLPSGLVNRMSSPHTITIDGSGNALAPANDGTAYATKSTSFQNGYVSMLVGGGYPVVVANSDNGVGAMGNNSIIAWCNASSGMLYLNRLENGELMGDLFWDDEENDGEGGYVSGGIGGVAAGVWVKLSRSGTTVKTWTSTDSTDGKNGTWTEQHSVDLAYRNTSGGWGIAGAGAATGDTIRALSIDSE